MFGAFSLVEVELALRFVAQGLHFELEVEAEGETVSETETGVVIVVVVEVVVEVEAGPGPGPEEVYEVLLCVLVYYCSLRLT